MRRRIRGFAAVGALGLLLVPACLTGQTANVGSEDPEGGGGAGDACSPGATRSAGDGCNTCACLVDGTWACTNRACEPQCEPGTAVPSPDGCNWCACGEDGTLDGCTEKACAACIISPTFEGCVHEPRYAREPRTNTCCFYADACDAPPGWEQFTSFEACTDYDPTCPPGGADCDGQTINGCEVSILFDEHHCGFCGFECAVPVHGSAICNYGSCGYTCDAGWLDCNQSSADGCESAGESCAE